MTTVPPPADPLPPADGEGEPSPPREPLGRLFLRFLRFGALAWGGPFAQIAMIHAELVERERWISQRRFNRTLAVYQALPGPEAHELCVFFGTIARGRIGGLLAGLGFMLPGFVLMLALSGIYVSFGTATPALAAVFVGFQAAVVAVVVRAVHRIGRHAVTDRWLLLVAACAFLAQLAGLHFGPTLLAAGAAHALAGRGRRALAAALLVALVLAGAGAGVGRVLAPPSEPVSALAPSAGKAEPEPVAPSRLFASGLKAGLLTFGGAYTVIPFLERDAVDHGRWLTHAEFLDGLALGGILPAPLVIFGTFVGFVASGLSGALAITAGIFLPAFAFTMIGHEALERLVSHAGVARFLDGVTAGVVGLIAATCVDLLAHGVTSVPALVIFALALAAAWLWKARGAVAGIVLGGGALAGLLHVVSG